MGIYVIELAHNARKFVTVVGRDEWALLALICAGKKGCTPIDNPAPRWSGYIYNLRRKGFDIETKREPHDGAFPGIHGRYILHSKVRAMPTPNDQAA